MTKLQSSLVKHQSSITFQSAFTLQTVVTDQMNFSDGFEQWQWKREVEVDNKDGADLIFFTQTKLWD